MGLDGATPAEKAGFKVDGADKFMAPIQNPAHQKGEIAQNPG